MKNKQRLFIYDRKEIIVLFLIVVMAGVFAFTLGVHLGKRVGPKGMMATSNETPLATTLQDKLPNRQELDEQGQGSQQAIQETLSQELHNEVTRTGLKLEDQRQVDLPEKPKTKTAGATHLDTHPPADIIPKKAQEAHAGAFSLQIGSYPNEGEAKKQLAALERNDLKGFIREVELKGKGKWYRLYLGSFSSKSLAEQAGAKYKGSRKISSYMVLKVPHP